MSVGSSCIITTVTGLFCLMFPPTPLRFSRAFQYSRILGSASPVSMANRLCGAATKVQACGNYVSVGYTEEWAPR